MNPLVELPEIREVPDVGRSPGQIASTQPAVEMPLATLLNEIHAFLRRFISFTSDAQPVVIALWVAHTWLIEAFEFTPYLHILSPTKQCGKSRLLDCFALIVRNVWRAVSMSVAALFRTIEKDQPTLLMDEVDAVFRTGVHRDTISKRLADLPFEAGKKGAKLYSSEDALAAIYKTDSLEAARAKQALSQASLNAVREEDLRKQRIPILVVTDVIDEIFQHTSATLKAAKNKVLTPKLINEIFDKFRNAPAELKW